MGKMQVGDNVRVAGELELLGVSILKAPKELVGEIAEHLCETLIQELRPIVDATDAENDADFLMIVLNQHKRWVAFSIAIKIASCGHILLDMNLFVDMLKSKWMESTGQDDAESNAEFFEVLEAMKVPAGLADKIASGIFA